LAGDEGAAFVACFFANPVLFAAAFDELDFEVSLK
jgi:hypothetical protein